ncbi:MAG: carbohydrate binding family 9 domain-containing protein, partial [Acidobacteria bacterium]|nr:carbohydrate binding family 9 domain-containing protein [Acidobacteriota bacterium]
MPVKQTSTFIIALLLCTLLSPLLMASQDRPEGRQHGRGSLTLIRTQQPVVLDGRLDEEAWGKANVVRALSQRDPEEGMPATEKTEIRALYDQESLYFGVKCFDSDAEGILATELRRDNAFINDDSFAVILDTFHDHRNAFLFRINPRGTQYDALITEEGRDVNVSWDERWEVETRIEEDGWSAEIRIPLSSIRFSTSSGESTTFGVDFERIIRRKNEFVYWNNFSRDFDFHQVSQAGHLLGMEETGNQLRVRIKPYLSTRINTRGAAQRSTILLGNVGLEDLKYPLTSG